ncbi:Transcription regulator, SpoVT/AbrB family [Pyrococcus yayanosii CH1]|uniref:Transcription regulator, SpoVT/AbrB family n=1 Tax=Pyrococcus yayanosii (strain CH1 / JCM 16557) TaxID=529709 RepID=F8AIC7_PYRYC|nr:Transcription regulator, SpoVT/AbrB family [Pyrococcus yayanosii CH1]
MVSIRLKVGPKGQIVIPKVFREAYGIKEGKEVIIEPTERGLVIRAPVDAEKLMEKLRERRKRMKGRGVRAKLGDLRSVDLEDEFDEGVP